MKSLGIKFHASVLAIAAVLGSSPALAQSKVPADADKPEADPDVITVTATLRRENLQDVPIAVTAVSGEALDKAGVKDIKGFEQVSASFNSNSTQTESGGTTLRIRGVGTTGNNTGLESAVGIFLDGVYLSRPGIALNDLLDVEQIELLRGPQGTLFGRNTSAGAVNIKTAKPNLERVEGFANATYGNYNLMNVQAGFSIPLAENSAAIRLSGAWRDRDGFIQNASGGQSNTKNRYLVRGQFYFEPSNALSLRVIGDYSRSDELCCDALILRESSYATAGVFVVSGLPANGGAAYSGPSALANFQTSNSTEFHDKIDQWGVSAEFNYDLGAARVTSITGYRNFRSSSQQETDFVSVGVFSTSNGGSTANANSAQSYTHIKTFTQELRITGSVLSDKVDYLVGAFYSDERISEIQSMTMGPDHQAYISAALTSVGVPGPNPALNIFAGGVSSNGSYANNLFTQNARNWSVFTNNTINFSDSFKINFGLRYSNDTKDGAFDQLSASSPACTAVRARAGLLPVGLQPLAPLAIALTCFPFATQVNTGAGTPLEFARTFKDNELVYTGKLLWEPVENVHTYLSYSHGYKSGGFNLDPTAGANGADPRFRSETVNAYEFGIKAKGLDKALTVNFALFQQNLKDFQVLEFTGVQFVTFNVNNARARGFELETTIRPARNFTISNSVTFSDTRYGKNCDLGVFNTTVSPLCGQRLTNAPLWTIVTGFDWTHDLGTSLEFGLNASLRFESDRRTSSPALLQVAAGTGTLSVANFPGGVTNNYVLNPEAIQDANAKVNLRASLGSQDGHWTIELWGNNVFDVRTRNVTFNIPLRGAASLPGALNAGGISVARGAYVQEPRTFGATLRGKF